MNILYYTWNENSRIDMTDALIRMGHMVVSCQVPFQNYEEDSEFSDKLEKLFKEYNCDIFLSFDFFPLIAKTAEKLKKKYVSWVYDAPHNTLCSPSVLSDYVEVFLFDKDQYLKVSAYKNSHIYHMPLAANTIRLNNQLGLLENVEYKQDISFVGSLYEKNMYQQVNYLPEYVKGYIEGIIQVQKKVYGYNLIPEVLSQNVGKELEKYIQLDIDPTYFMTKDEIYEDMIQGEITHQERVELLKEASKYGNFKLFTASSSEELPSKVFSGILSYEEEMPEVFRESKINLNITLRSITSGIPLRALDIMGAGGFLLSNYQPELAEYFVDGEEIVLFSSKEDMVEKILYYLENEEERKRIAYNGWKKVCEEFSYEKQLEKIFRAL